MQPCKNLVKNGMRSEDALKKATEATGLDLSQNTVLRACLKIQPDLTIGIGLHI